MTLKQDIATEIRNNRLSEKWTSSDLLENDYLKENHKINTLRTYPSNYSITLQGGSLGKGNNVNKNRPAFLRVGRRDGALLYALPEHTGHVQTQEYSESIPKNAPSESKMISIFTDELVEKLATYLDIYKSNERLSEIYQWPIDKAIDELKKIDTNSPISVDRKNTFNDTLIVRKIVKEKLNDERLSEQKKSAYIKWIVRDWGGIKTGDIDKLLNTIQNNSYKIEGIASRSKYYSFNDPENFAIYDARVIYSLNWLLLKYKSDAFFPDLTGRNTLMNPLDYTMDILLKYRGVETIRSEIVTDINKRNNNPNANSSAIKNLQNGRYIKNNAAYLCYCELLKRIANKLYVNSDDTRALTKTEMILFAIADKDIALDVFDYKYKLK